MLRGSLALRPAYGERVPLLQRLHVCAMRRARQRAESAVRSRALWKTRHMLLCQAHACHATIAQTSSNVATNLPGSELLTTLLVIRATVGLAPNRLVGNWVLMTKKRPRMEWF